MCIEDARLRSLPVFLLAGGIAITACAPRAAASQSTAPRPEPITSIHRDGPTGDAVPLLSPRPKSIVPQEMSPDEQTPEVFNDPVPPALWSGMSTFLLVGLIAAARRLRRGLRRTGSTIRA